MEPEDIERKIRDIIKYSRDKQPILRIIKNNGDSKFGVYMQIGDFEGGGKALYVMELKILMIPLIEIYDMEYVAKNKACYALNHSLVFE